METYLLRSNTQQFLVGRDENIPGYSQHVTPIVIKGERISRAHLQLTCDSAGRWEAMDLGSTNGTYLIGRAGKLTAHQAIKLSEGTDVRFFLGGHLLTLSPNGGEGGRPLVHVVDLKETALLEVNGVTVDRPAGKGKFKRIIQNISFTAFPQRVMAIMGGSGTGKSTLLKAINGYEPPTAGSVQINETNLYSSVDIRQSLGYLPQEDIFHEKLSIKEVLDFTSRLRNPALSPDQRSERVDQAIRDVALESAAADGRLAAVLSGGQKKRLGIAMELLSKPRVLFLDEPTSGLSSEDSYDLLCTLRRIARTHGTCIIMVIHQPSIDVFKQIDDLVVLKKDPDSPAEVVYAGPAYPGSIQYFQRGIQQATLDERYGANLSPDVILLATEGSLEKGSFGWDVNHWRSTWAGSGYAALHLPVPTTIENKELPPLRPFGFGQFFLLLERSLKLKMRDRKTMLLVFLQPLVIGIALAVSLGSFAEDATPILWNHHFFMMFSALWCGASNPPNEIVGEWKILFRERMVNLKVPSYYFSKLATFVGFSFIQATLLGVTLGLGWSLKIPLFTLIGVLWLTAVAGNVLGLLISTLASTSEFAVSLVPVPLIFMLLFAGGPLKRLPDMNVGVLYFTYVMPSRWSFESLVQMEANAHGEIGNNWHRSHFELKKGAGQNQPVEDTQRGVSLTDALRNLGLWILAGITFSVWALKRRVDKA